MIRGPFPKRELSQRSDGCLEHVVYGPVSYAIYTTLPFDDARVQAAINAYLATAGPRSSGEADHLLVDAVMRARDARQAKRSNSPNHVGAMRAFKHRVVLGRGWSARLSD